MTGRPLQKPLRWSLFAECLAIVVIQIACGLRAPTRERRSRFSRKLLRQVRWPERALGRAERRGRDLLDMGSVSGCHESSLPPENIKEITGTFAVPYRVNNPLQWHQIRKPVK